MQTDDESKRMQLHVLGLSKTWNMLRMSQLSLVTEGTPGLSVSRRGREDLGPLA